MASLNVDIDYFGHPKTKALVRLLGRGSEVLPLKLWVYAARYFPKDGRLTGISAQEIEHECLWWGSEGQMIDVFLKTRFLEMDGQTYVVHDWLEHEGHITAFRERAVKGAKARWDRAKGDPPGDASSNASSIASSNAPTYLPSDPTNPPSGEAGKVVVKDGPGGKPNRKGPHAALSAHFTESWLARFGTKYDFQGGKDGTAIGRILTACDGDLSRAKRMVEEYLHDSEKWISEQGHTVAILAMKTNRYLSGGHKGKHPPPAQKAPQFGKAEIAKI